MEDWLQRQRMLIGEEACEKLRKSTIAVVGLGGVGGACAEALCRCGVGPLILVDHDTVDSSNLNRQVMATLSSIGMAKTTACEKRLRDISPMCEIQKLEMFYDEETAEQLFALMPDYIVDCIDTVTAKLHLAESCVKREIPLLMCLGTGNRLDPSQFRVGDLSETAAVGGCGLARVMRRELKRQGIVHQQVLYSTEAASKTVISDSETGRNAPGSIAFCPPVAGYLLAGQVVRDIVEK
ncbi:MAG: tRNA threonylcarbamoyladenosine dehydratase [Oscillospiraceae bacterium]